jgi:hypothetical protein
VWISTAKSLSYSGDLQLLVAEQVALPEDAALALLDVRRAPRRVEVVQRDEPILHVRAGAHLLGRAHEHADLAGAHRVEERLFLHVGLRLVDERDLVARDAEVDEPSSAQRVVDREPRRPPCGRSARRGPRTRAACPCGFASRFQMS